MVQCLGRKKNSNKIAIVPPRIGIPYLHGNKTLKSKADSDGHANDADGDGDAKDMTLFKPAAYLSQNEAPLVGFKVVLSEQTTLQSESRLYQQIYYCLMPQLVKLVQWSQRLI